MADHWRTDTSPDESRVVKIDRSLVIRGEVTGSKDLLIEGQFEGQINLHGHDLTTGPDSRVNAVISAKAVVVQGAISGDIAASEKVELAATSRVTGDIIAPSISIADGACLKGEVDISGVRSVPLQVEPAVESHPVQPKPSPRPQSRMSTLPRREFRPASQ
jgi:cytoskeletal protein CcmA (bactofilin family)